MDAGRNAPAILSRLRGAPHLAAWLALLVASSVWFFTGSDERGRTARPTADADYYHVYLPSLVLDGDLDFANQYELTGNHYGFGRTETGRPANVFGIGPALFELPAFLVGHAAAAAMGKRANGFSVPELHASLYMSLLASLAALIPAFRLLRRRLGGELAPLAAPLLLFAAGPVLYYAIRQPGYAHPFATLWVAWLVERWDASFDGDAPRSLGTWSLLGLLVGAAALARPQCALWAVLLVSAAVDDIGRAPARRAALKQGAPRWLAGALLSVLVFAPQMLAWKALHGAYLVVPQGPGFAWWLEPAWSEVLFSSRNGLLPWAPLYALAAIGLLVAAARTPRVGLALVVGVGLQIVANGAAWDWWAGGSFGGRRFDSAAIAFAYGLGALIGWPTIWARRDWRARAGQAAIAAALVLSLLLAAANMMLASRSASATVPLFGGVPASRVFAGRIPGPLGSLAAAASSLANLPARLLFAWRHDTGLDAYDHIVGVHQLGDLYPGLNRWRPAIVQAVALDAPGHRIVGLRPGAHPRTASMTGTRARILLGFNRRDPITFVVRASSAAPGAIELWLDGQRLAGAQLSARPSELRGTVPRARRGVNVLEIRAVPGTVLHSLDLRATRDPVTSLPGN